MDDSVRTPGRGAPHPRRGRTRIARRVAKAAALVLFIIAASAAGTAVYYYVSSAAVRDAVGILVAGIDGPEEAFPGRDEIDVLVMGRDVDRDRYGRIVDTHSRTDTIILAHIDFRSQGLNLLSIPRDTLVRIPEYRGKRRISYANAYGGPELARKTIFSFLGVQPDYYVLLSFDGFEKAIDSIGGLEVEVDKQLDYDDNWGRLHIHLKPGRQTLNGEQAIGFVRYRRSNDGDAESDFVRIKRQHKVLKAARARLADPLVMFRMPKVVDMINTDMESDLTPAQAACLVRFLRSLPESAIRMDTLPALEGGGVFVRADMDAARELVRAMFLDNP